MTPRRGPGEGRAQAAIKALVLAGACIALLAFKLRRHSAAHTEGQQPERCKHWAAASRLGGGCIGTLQPGTSTFPCCTNGSLGTSCPACSQHLLQSLECLAPRQMLLRPQPGCAALPPPLPRLPPPLPPQLPCSLAPKALAAGSWVQNPPGTPAAPHLSFQPAAPCRQKRPLGSAEVPGCLWAAGFDRVVVSGDSTARQLYTRLIGLIRQQQQVVDAGASLVYAHYTLTTRQPTAGAVPHSSSNSSGGSSGSASSSDSPSGSSSTRDGSSIFTDSLWFSPPGNVRPGQFNMTSIDIGLQHLLLRTTAGAAQAADGTAGLTGGKPAGMQPGAAAADGETAAAAAAAAAAGPLSSRRLTLDFVVGPLSGWQQKHVQSYLLSPLWSGPAWQRSTLLLLSLCVWEQDEAAPEGWLAFIEEMRRQVAQVVLLTCPTDRFRTPDREAGRAVIARRNDIVRQLVADSWSGRGSGSSSSGSGGDGNSSGSESSSSSGTTTGTSPSGSSAHAGSSSSRPRPLLLLDLDALTQQGLPPGLAISAEDYHYQCYPTTSSGFSNGTLEWAGGDGSARPRYSPRKFEFLLVPGSGSCADPVNFAAWQLLLGALCNAGT